MKLIIAGIISPKRDNVNAFVRRHDTDNLRVGMTRTHYTNPDASWVGVTVYDRGAPVLIALRDEDNATRIRLLSLVELRRLFAACKTGTEADAAERYVLAMEIANELSRRANAMPRTGRDV